MALFDKFPYTDYHTLNLDWILSVFGTEIEPAAQLVKDVPAMRDEVAADTAIVVAAKNAAESAKDVSVTSAETAKNYGERAEAAAKSVPLDYSEMTRIVDAVTSYNTQFLPLQPQHPEYYWSDSLGLVSNLGYSAYDKISLPAGTYYTQYLSNSFTFIKRASGSVTKLGDLGSTFTIDEPFEIYPSGNIVTAPLAMITDNPSFVPTKKVDGFYNLSPAPVFYVGPSRAITSLKDGVELATNHMGATVYVDAGVYDLVEEFGLEFLDGYNKPSMFGLVLKNNVHLVFSSNSKIVFNYTGSNSYVHEYFSPFNSGMYGFTVEGATVVSKNCRYAVHDERNASDDSYHNIYKRCHFSHDSSGTTWGAHQAVGGGLGKHGDILIEDCTATSAGTDEVISYHNADTADDCKSNIVVRDCYLDGYFRVSNMGSYTTKSTAYCSNCSMTKAAEYRRDGAKPDNMELLAWNNVIR